MFTFLEMLAMVVPESSFGANVPKEACGAPPRLAALVIVPAASFRKPHPKNDPCTAIPYLYSARATHNFMPLMCSINDVGVGGGGGGGGFRLKPHIEVRFK